MTSPENLAGGFNVDPLEGMLWGPLRSSFGLTPEQWKRLTEVVTLQMALDRFLFLKVLLGLTMAAGDRANVPKITARVNQMRLRARLELAEAAGWIPEDLANDIAAVNTVRNKLLHATRNVGSSVLWSRNLRRRKPSGPSPTAASAPGSDLPTS